MKGRSQALDRPLVLATRNPGKVSEFRELLSGFEIEIKSLEDFGTIPMAAEDGATFEENASKKARFTAGALGLPALADDSGLVVPALGGVPGVRSARYAGDDANDLRNNLKLLHAMEGIKDRRAVFRCVIAVAVPRGLALLYKGRCEGEITESMAGTQGFGYDPLFYYPPLKKTFASMSLEEKNRVSHRGRAMAKLQEEFSKVLQWLRVRLKEEKP